MPEDGDKQLNPDREKKRGAGNPKSCEKCWLSLFLFHCSFPQAKCHRVENSPTKSTSWGIRMSPVSQEEFFSNTPYSAPALQLVNAPALDLQVKRAYKWFTNHPNDLTGFVMSMDSSGTSVLVTFRSAGKQKWQFSQFLPSKSQSLQSMTARFRSCQEVLPSLTCKFIWGRIHDTVLQERFFFFLIHTLTLRKMGKQAAGNQLPTKLQGFTGAMKQNIFNAGLQALSGCMDLPRFCTSSPSTPQGSPRPPQFQQHH